MSDFIASGSGNGLPWPRCTAGSADIRAQYQLLGKLNVPLGTTDADILCRDKILQELVKFNEKMGLQSDYLNRMYSQHVKVPRLRRGKADPGDLLHQANIRTHFFDSFLANLLPSRDKEQPMVMLCSYIAKYHNAAFVKSIPVAREIEGKQAKAMQKTDTSAPSPNLIMYDGGSRENPHHVSWNVHYQQLLAYREEHGNCLVPTRKTKNLPEQLRSLSQWVTSQRSSKKQNVTGMLTLKRIELLESVGFAWEVYPDNYKGITDERWHKAVAAKLHFEPFLTARDAMIISGFPEEEATDESRKKSLNATVCKFHAGNPKIKAHVLGIVSKLRNAPKDNGDKEMENVYGTSEILSRLRTEGKLVPRDQKYGPLAKKQRVSNAENDENSHDPNSLEIRK